MSFRSLDELQGEFDAAIRDFDDRLKALETRHVRLGNYWIRHDGSGNLVAVHVTTGHSTTIATTA